MEALVEFLLPSWLEVQVSVAAVALVVTAYCFLTVIAGADDRNLVDSSVANVDDDKEEDHYNFNDDKLESRLYVGNLDLRITEASLIKMFSPFGKIVSEDFLWHTRGPKRGEPHGYAFIQFSSKEEAIRAKEKMHGRMACGRPLVVRLASEKYPVDGSANSSRSAEGSRSSLSGGGGGQTSRSTKIATIKNKLKAIDEESHKTSKKQKQSASSATCFERKD